MVFDSLVVDIGHLILGVKHRVLHVDFALEAEVN